MTSDTPLQIAEEKKIYKELFETPTKQFESVLSEEFNNKMIFSGRYGCGKSTFLNYFFDQEKIQKQYEPYKISPVNYSISSNEDIINYIKYDIIIQFLEKEKNIKEVEFSSLSTLPWFVINKGDKICANILHMVPKVGKDITIIYNKIGELKSKFEEYKKDINTSDGDKMIDYLEELEKTDGSIYENNAITQIISSIISNNKSILIVDDLDRLDPEHVFRILNVFAVHLQSGLRAETRNKFNFSKIILVCDINNLRSIFHHKYGEAVDFNGYIDKFYSSDIFHFDNTSSVVAIIKSIINSITLPDYSNGEKAYFIETSYFTDFLVFLLEALVATNNLTIRNIMRMYGKTMKHHKEVLNFKGGGFTINAFRIPIVFQLRIIRDILGDYKNMMFKLVETSKIKREYYGFESYFRDLFYISTIDSHLFQEVKERVVFNKKKIRFETTAARGIRVIHEDPILNPSDTLYIPTIEDLWCVLIDVTNKLYSIGYLK